MPMSSSSFAIFSSGDAFCGDLVGHAVAEAIGHGYGGQVEVGVVVGAEAVAEADLQRCAPVM